MKNTDIKGVNKMKALVPTDFSGHALNAGVYAINLFKKSISEIILENVYQLPKENTGTLISVNDIIVSDSEKRLKIEQEELKRLKKGISVSFESKEGNPVTTVKQSFKKLQANLLVIGHNSKIDKFSHSFIGQPEYWPALLVPGPKFTKPAKEAIIISATVKNELGITPEFQEIDERYRDNAHLLYFTKNSTVEHLKDTVNSLLSKNKKIGIIIFSTTKDDHLEQAIKGHRLDSIFFSHPSLLISNNGGK